MTAHSKDIGTRSTARPPSGKSTQHIHGPSAERSEHGFQVVEGDRLRVGAVQPGLGQRPKNPALHRLDVSDGEDSRNAGSPIPVSAPDGRAPSQRRRRLGHDAHLHGGGHVAGMFSVPKKALEGMERLDGHMTYPPVVVVVVV